MYSLYRGDTAAKVRNITFSNDNRWLAVNSKRGTTHIFPINPCGGAVNARTHSKPFVVNRTSKHQRTAGFTDQEDMMLSQQDHHHHHHHSDYSSSSPIVLHNNPKIRNLLEPFIIPAYGQLKQPNVNSQFQSSIISSNSSNSTGGGGGGAGGLLSAVSSGDSMNGGGVSNFNFGNMSLAGISNGSHHALLSGLTGSNLAASAFSSAALVTENVSNFGRKNFSILGTS
jgi:hypothetical protein